MNEHILCLDSGMCVCSVCVCVTVVWSLWYLYSDNNHTHIIDKQDYNTNKHTF